MAPYIKKTIREKVPNTSKKKTKISDKLSYKKKKNLTEDNGFQPFAVFFYFCSPLAR
jgi:hypothetical protein